MKKKIALVGLLALMMIPFGACGKSNNDDPVSSPDSIESTDSSSVTDDSSSVADDSSSVTDDSSSNDSTEHVHTYAFVEEKAGNCSNKSEVAHYTCEECGKIFDLTKNEIQSVEGDYDYSVHSSEALIELQAQPTKLTYNVGETFDPTGMVVVLKCNDCDGEIVDNQFLTYEYQTADATAFAVGDSKILVKFNDKTIEVAISVGKKQAEIFGAQETYKTVCGVAPIIEVTSNSPESEIVFEYFDDETKVEASDLIAGKTYTVKMSIADTDTLIGTETTATVIVNHDATWRSDESDPNKLVCKCNCGEGEVYSVKTNQEMYVDDADMSIDLSKLVVGTEDYTIQSIQQVLLLNDNEKVAIEGTNEGMVYTFAKDKYEKLTEDWTPYFLKLSVVYAFGNNTVEVFFTAKYVEKIIRTAEDLKVLAYKGAATVEEGGTMITGQYVLAGDIDASGLVLDASNYAWQAMVGFCGVLEGNGYTISNLSVPAWTNGLFGALGYNGKVQNVTFKNVMLGEGANMFALVMRNAFLTNVTIEFSSDSAAYKIAEHANDCTFENVSILTKKGVNPFTINEDASAPMPETITFNYFASYTVTFNTDGGNAMDPVYVTEGKKLSAPKTPQREASATHEYVFLGWYVGEEEWNFDTPITEDIELTAKWEEAEKAARVEVSLPLGQMTDTGTTNDYGKVYDLKQGQWFIDNSQENGSKETLIDFQKGKLAETLPTGGEYFEFWLYNPTETAYTFRLAGAANAGWLDSANPIALPSKTWTRVTISAEDIQLNTEGAWYAYIRGGDNDGATKEGWQVSTVYAVMKHGWTPDEPDVPDVPDIPEVCAHVYVYVEAEAGNCSQKGKIAHYACENCELLFDVDTKEEITSIEGDYNKNVHSSATLLAVQTQPSKLTYNAGEVFDPTGMVVVLKCNDCEGEAIDTQLLRYQYQTAGAAAFVADDNKITVKYNDLTAEIEVSVGRKQAEISGVQEAYETVCGVAPVIEATSNVPGSNIIIQYFDGETEVQPAEFTAGKTYTVKVTVEETDLIASAQVTATVTVNHDMAWRADENDENKLVCGCSCGEGIDAFVMTNQEKYVDDADMSIDLSKLVVGTEDYTVQSVQQVLLLNDNEKVAIEGTNEGMVYTFAKDKYEKLTEDWTPYFLKLSVVYAFGDNTVEVFFTAKYVEKIIRTAEDLKVLAYKGADTAEAGGTMITGQYILAGDIDASGLVLDASNYAWQAMVGFCGVLEGNGYTISNLSVPAWTYGLFGALGYNGKVQNVTFKNVTVGEGANMFALVMRNAFLTNVTIEFSSNSAAYKIAEHANDCTFENVSILTERGVNPFTINEDATASMPETITFNYFASYTVTFNTDGGNAIDPAYVTEGRKVSVPATPTKAPDDTYDYTFLGWYVGEEEWNFDTPITEDIELTAKWEAIEKAARVEVSLPLGQMTDTGTTNDYGKVYDLKQGQWFIDNSQENGSKETLIDFQKGKLAETLPTGGEYFEFWLYNPTETAYTFRLAGAANAGWLDSANPIALPSKTWTRVTISAEDIQLNTEGTWYTYIRGGDNDGATKEGWQVSTVYAVMEAGWTPSEEPESNVLLDAATQTLEKSCSYGGDIVVEKATDETYGNIWNITVGEVAEQGFHHAAIDTADFERVYFYVYNPLAKEARLAIHGGWNAWGVATVNLSAQSWTKIELNVSAFTEDVAGKIFPVLQDPDAVSLAGEWKITSFYGLKAGETAPEVETPVVPDEPDEPEETTTNVLLDAATQTLEKSCSYGGDIVVEKATDETYGNVWNITVGEVAEQGFHHAAIDTADFERVYFYVYNPLAKEARLAIHGGWNAWGVATVNLSAQSWTKIELNVSAFTEDVAGKIFPVLQDPDAVSLAGEWKITSFYGLKAGETAPEVETPETPDEPTASRVEVALTFGEMTDTGTTNDYGKVYNITQEQYFIDENLANTIGTLQTNKLAGVLPEGYEYLEFWMYNPTEETLTLHLAGDVNGTWTDSADFTSLAAKAWTRVVISSTDIQNNTNGTWYVYLYKDTIGNGYANVSGWQISTVYAAKTEQAEVSLTFGQMTDTGTTNEYGKVYNISREQWFIDNNHTNTIGTLSANALANALPAGYESFEFWMYNPTDTEYTFHLAGGDVWADSENSIALTAKAWTKVIISASDIEANKAGGNWYVYILNGDGAGAAKEGWQISTIYAVKA